MDEIEVLPVHQWLCACRQLMFAEPAFGAQEYAAYLFPARDPRLKLGWNRVLRHVTSHQRESYIFIGEDEGLSSDTPPPGIDPDSIPTVDSVPPSPATSALWSRARELASQVSSHDPPDYPPPRVEAVMRNIEREVMRDPERHDLETMRTWGRASLVQLDRARNGSRAGQILMAEFLAPARDVIGAYLSFELTGTVAREVLALVLSVQCNLPELGLLQTTSATDRAQAVEHLADLSEGLLAAREHAQVTSYFELAYLACLLGSTAIVLNSQQRELAPGYDRQDTLDRRTLFVDELLAHEVSPTFLLPAALEPLEMTQFVRQRADALGQAAGDYARSRAVHPALQSSVLDAPDVDEIDAAEASTRYQRAAASAERVDALAIANDKTGPVAPENAKQMLMHLTAYSMGM